MSKTRPHRELATVTGEGLRFVESSDTGLTLALDSGPNATAPNPVEALLAALGACTGMDVITILRKKRQHVTGYTVELVGQRREEHPRAFTAIELVHRLSGRGLSPAAVSEARRRPSAHTATGRGRQEGRPGPEPPGRDGGLFAFCLTQPPTTARTLPPARRLLRLSHGRGSAHRPGRGMDGPRGGWDAHDRTL